MKCPNPKCDVENEDSARFCRGCGTSLKDNRLELFQVNCKVGLREERHITEFKWLSMSFENGYGIVQNMQKKIWRYQ